MIRNAILCFLFINFAHSLQNEKVNSNIVFENVDRSIDLTTQIAKITSKILVKNDGPVPVSGALYAINEKDLFKLTFMSAQSISAPKVNLVVKEATVQAHPTKRFWKILFSDKLGPGDTTIFEVNEFWTQVIEPYPQSITQKQKQLVRYYCNAYLYSPYKIKKITTTLVLQNRNIENYTKLKSVSLSETMITYGPYNDIEPFSENKIMAHYENTTPFLLIKSLQRDIEISHWGNIAVEETVEIVHVGAKFKGPFSRYDYQRDSSAGQASVKSFKMMLPAAAVGVYYRDDIGNISTSYMRVMKDAIEVELKPRFPLFGGWQTRFVIGYNLPSYEYLYSNGYDYLLKMRLIDHVYDDMVIDDLTVRIILPEGIHSMEFAAPYPVKRLPDTLHHTYLDTKGRPVITLKKTNLIENHIQDFSLKYKFHKMLMLQEPFLVVIALYCMFMLVIVYVRLDFAITKDNVNESKMRVAGFCEKIMIHHDKRSYLYRLYDAQLCKLMSPKEVNTFTTAIKAITVEHKTETNIINELAQKMKPDAPEVFDKIQEMQKLDRLLRELYGQRHSLYVDKLVPGKIGRSAFVDAENSFFKKKKVILDSITNICKSLE